MFIAPIQPIETFEKMRAEQKNVSSTAGIPFASMLQESMDELRRNQAQADQDSIDLALGQGGDLHTMMINSAALDTAVKTTVQLTTRAVSAYKEIMQMQV